MAEYNIQMNRYVSASDSYDQLFPKTKTVDVVDQDNNNLDTLLADKQDEILISGVLKGNGAGGVSAAVAGTDFAPARYGLGTRSKQLTSADDLNNVYEGGFYAWWGSDVPANIPRAGDIINYATMIVLSRSNTEYVQIVYSVYPGSNRQNLNFIRTAYNNVWYPWECVNPPMETNVVYRTTERRNGLPVYKKQDSNGVQYWSTDQTNWNAESTVKIETGSYVGTGTYGASNPNSITFGFVPKFVMIWIDANVSLSYTFGIMNTVSAGNTFPSSSSAGYFRSGSGSSSGTTRDSFSRIDGNTIYWYTTSSNATDQLNNNNTTYYYLAIG